MDPDFLDDEYDRMNGEQNDYVEVNINQPGNQNYDSDLQESSEVEDEGYGHIEDFYSK